MIDPGTVILVIQAGIKPASKVSAVIIDDTFERDLNLPLGDDDQRLQTLVGGVTQSLLEDYAALTSAEEKNSPQCADQAHLLQRVRTTSPQRH